MGLQGGARENAATSTPDGVAWWALFQHSPAGKALGTKLKCSNSVSALEHAVNSGISHQPVTSLLEVMLSPALNWVLICHPHLALKELKDTDTKHPLYMGLPRLSGEESRC